MYIFRTLALPASPYYSEIRTLINVLPFEENNCLLGNTCIRVMRNTPLLHNTYIISSLLIATCLLSTLFGNTPLPKD